MDISWCEMLRYSRQSLPKQMQPECQWRTGSGSFFKFIFLSSLA
jgi:hypothetical protein